ncbi:MAG TPA: ABC transporter permease, partial [Salinisphaeraceae bacterium]|nr:ABC transporter permease [Salinisphaeraceae bacterium]
METARLLLEFDPDMVYIVLLSLRVSLTATLLAAMIGLLLGGAVALYSFPGRNLIKALLNAFMGLPPVVAGLTVYLLLSRSGPLGELGLLFTPSAMIIVQAVLVTPIIAALTRQHIADLDAEYREQLTTLNTGSLARLRALLWDGRFALLTV